MTGDVDCGGAYLLPGLVDLHTDAVEKYFEPRPGIFWNPLAAAVAHDAQVAASGITTVFDALPFGTSYRKIERKTALGPILDGLAEAAKAGVLRAEHFLHARCEVTDPDTIGILEPYLTDPRLRFITLMDHAPGHRQSPDVLEYRRRHLASQRLTEAQMDEHIDSLLQRSQELGPRIRADLVRLGHEHGIPMGSHDDETVAHVDLSASEGLAISEFPTSMAAAQRARACGLANLMGGPNVVRGGSSYGNVSALDLAKAGLLDLLASDYVPASMLHAVFLLAGAGGAVGLPEAVGWASAAPAAVAGLHDRGEVAPGKRADLILVQLAGEVPVVRATYVAGGRVV
jgi:alpha-D-ribose 1-methylphosphonate 5-triphosphate diphosphatase